MLKLSNRWRSWLPRWKLCQPGPRFWSKPRWMVQKAVPVPGGGGHPGVPSVSSGLPLFAGPPATAFSKYTSLVGPPPKVRAPVPSAHLPASKFNSGSSSGGGGSEWTCSSFVTAKHSGAGAGLALGQSERSFRRHPGGQCSFHFRQRSAKKGENATGPRYGVLGLLPPGYATVAQKALPVTAFAEDHRRAWPPFSPDLLGAQWRIQNNTAKLASSCGF